MASEENPDRNLADILRHLPDDLFPKASLEGAIYDFAISEFELPADFYKPIVDENGSDELSLDAKWRLAEAQRLGEEASKLGLDGAIPIYGGRIAYLYSVEGLFLGDPPTEAMRAAE